MKEWLITPERFLSKPELGRLLQKVEDGRTLGVSRGQAQPVRDWLIVRLAVLSGLRASEICDLRVSDCRVGYAEAEVFVRCGKGGRCRRVRIGNDLKRDLRWFLKWLSERGEVLPEDHLIRSQRSDKITANGLWRRWKKYCPSHRLHDARHTNATLLYAATKDIRLVQKQLGHSRPSVTAVYADVFDETTREGLASMDRAVRLAGKEPKACELPRNLPRSPAKVAGNVASP